MHMSEIIHGDCWHVLPTLPAQKHRLVYIDPPFNTGHTQKRRRIKVEASPEGKRTGFGNRQYTETEIKDTGSFEDRFDSLEEFLIPRIVAAIPTLTPDASIFVHLDYREVHYIKVALDAVFGRDSFMNEIIWAYDYGARSKTRWSTKHNTILWYALNPENYVFNYDAIDRIPYMAPSLVGTEKAEKGKTLTTVWWNTIVPTNGKEKTGYACLHPDSRVLSDEGWLPIEDIRVGMCVLASDGTFCEVEHVSHHYCGDPLVRLAVEGTSVTVDATSNHPFLVWREGEVAWVEAGQIRVGDYTMTPLSFGADGGTQKPCASTPVVTIKSKLTVSIDSFTLLSGRKSTDLYLKDTNFTIATTTRGITTCPTSNLSIPLRTNGFTPVANCVMESGGNHAGCVVCLNPPHLNTGTYHEGGLTEDYVNHVSLPKSSATVVFALHRVENVAVVPYSGNVWNLSVKGNPSFQTEVGMSHNTQKPLAILERIVRVHSKEGDTVLDFFAGSGTTGEAAKKLNREYTLIDQNPQACDLMRKRLLGE